MHRTFISLVTVAAMAVSGLTAAPAQASDKEAAQWIAGLAGLAIIGAAIADHDKKKKRRGHDQQTHQYSNHYGHSHYSHRQARPARRHVRRHGQHSYGYRQGRGHGHGHFRSGRRHGWH